MVYIRSSKQASLVTLYYAGVHVLGSSVQRYRSFFISNRNAILTWSVVSGALLFRYLETIMAANPCIWNMENTVVSFTVHAQLEK